jgi:hypothetical protein
MNNLLYIIAVVLVITWVIGTFVFAVGKLVHMLLVLAAVVIIVKIARGRKPSR